jgi:hypothetical protein
VTRAAALAAGDDGMLERLADTFAELACPYQQARTARFQRLHARDVNPRADRVRRPGT